MAMTRFARPLLTSPAAKQSAFVPDEQAIETTRTGASKPKISIAPMTG